MTTLDPHTACIDDALLARPWPRLLLGALAELSAMQLVTSEQAVRHARVLLAHTPGTSPEVHRRLRDLQRWLWDMDDTITVLNDHAFSRSDPAHEEINAWLDSLWDEIDASPHDALELMIAFFRDAGAVFTVAAPRLNQEALLAQGASAGRAVPRVLQGDEVLHYLGELLDRSPLDLLERAFLPLFSELPNLSCAMRELAQSLDSTFPATSAQILADLRSHKDYRRLACDLPAAPATLELVEHWAHPPAIVEVLKARKPPKPIPVLGARLFRRTAAHRTT